MESDELCAEQVLTSWDTAWDGEGHLALVGNQPVNTPLAATVDTILIDLGSNVRHDRVIWLTYECIP